MRGNGSLIVEIGHQEKGILMRSQMANPRHSCSAPLSQPWQALLTDGSHRQSLVVGTQVHLAHLQVRAR